MMSWSAKCSWNAETPGRVPAGARISAGKSGSVDRSLPNDAVELVNRSPVSCMPSPESPAKRMITRSSWTICLLTAPCLAPPVARRSTSLSRNRMHSTSLCRGRVVRTCGPDVPHPLSCPLCRAQRAPVSCCSPVSARPPAVRCTAHGSLPAGSRPGRRHRAPAEPPFLQVGGGQPESKRHAAGQSVASPAPSGPGSDILLAERPRV